MKPGYNTNGLAHHRLEEALELVARAGFRVAALTLDVPHLDPLRAGAGEVARTARALESLGLEVVVETGGRFLLDPARKHRPNLLEEDPEERKRRLDLLDRSLSIARDLGAPVMSLWSGVLPEGVSSEEAWKRLLEGLDILGGAAERKGVALALEPEPGHLVERVAHWRALSGEMGAKRPGLCLDVGHLCVLEEGPPGEALEQGDWPHLLQVHLDDSLPGRHEHLEPGQGVVDFPRVFQDLAEASYGGPACWELSRSSHRAPQAVQAAWETWLKWAGPPPIDPRSACS